MVVLSILPESGMGNQMCMYAAALALARREHQKLFLMVSIGQRQDRAYSLPLFSLAPSDIAGSLVLKNVRRSRVKKKILWLTPQLIKRVFSGCLRVEAPDESRRYSEIPQGHRAYYLQGYFESIQYIDPVLSSLRKQFQPSFPVSARTQALWDTVRADSHAVALHIRMGDFVALNLCFPLSYYENAITFHKSVDPDAHFYLLTEDTSVRRHFEGRKNVIPIDLSGEEHRDIVEWNCLTQCRHHILSSSTYSWWAALLSETEESVISIPTVELYHRFDNHAGDSTIRYQNFYRPGWHPVSAD